ncbi:hypothetical protein Agabi119p4_6690 [Agaricus bisporus var. burnettii]|uniref:Uncharacterized protein n=1 Tax=Agaricus bisporus var. burnettii TaxID=192524 RepID=A0A8H7CBM0_AGABI|nr:hypothetical protein Agabi119p4_6690 [Agaricus bisporus var. burnettii]
MRHFDSYPTHGWLICTVAGIVEILAGFLLWWHSRLVQATAHLLNRLHTYSIPAPVFFSLSSTFKRSVFRFIQSPYQALSTVVVNDVYHHRDAVSVVTRVLAHFKSVCNEPHVYS